MLSHVFGSNTSGPAHTLGILEGTERTDPKSGVDEQRKRSSIITCKSLVLEHNLALDWAWHGD